MSEVKKVRMYQLTSDRDACSKRRGFTLLNALQGKKEQFAVKSGIVKETIRELIEGIGLEQKTVPSNEDEAKEQADRIQALYDRAREEMFRKFEDIEYSSDAQRQVQAEDAFRDIVRYVQCLMARKHNWDKFKNGPRDIALDENLLVEAVHPDSIDVLPSPVDEDGKQVAECLLHAVVLKTSKPKTTESKAYESLELYALIKYLKGRTAPGHKVALKASVYYLRKANDSHSKTKPVYDEDFFDTNGGRNIVSIDTIYEAPSDGTEGETELDTIFKPVVKRYIAGIEESECDEDDCKNCELFDVCKYIDAPDPLPEKPSAGAPLTALKLSKAQMSIIDYDKGILRCNAGAGGGKTLSVALMTVTLLNKGVLPEEILLITFTNAGAEEMRTRVKKYCLDMGLDPELADKVVIMTFNAFGNMVIEEKATDLGFSAKPKIVDDVERFGIIKQLLADTHVNGLDYRNFSTSMRFCKGALAMASEIFEIAKAGRYGPADAEKVYNILKDKGDIRFISGGVNTIEKVLTLYDLYDEKMRENNLIEFADQEVLLFEILHKDPLYLNHFGFKHIICDEFQDSNAGQVKLLRLFTNCPSFESLVVVGDDSQSIFGFRDTRPDFMIHFDKCLACPEDWLDDVDGHMRDILSIPGAAIDDISLVENHRSTPEILDFANKLDAKNSVRIAKTLVATRPSGKPVIVKGFLTKEEERDFVIEKIKSLLAVGVLPETIAIIAATKRELMEMGDILSQNKIPSVMLNPEPLIENSRVRASIALINAIEDETDTKDLLAYANALHRGGLIGLPAEDIEKELSVVRKEIEELKTLKGDDRKTKILEMMREIDHNQDEIFESFIETLECKRNAKAIADYCKDFYEFGADTAVRRVHDYPGVVLTTAHSSKGLEWNAVINMISKYDGAEMKTAKRGVIDERRRLLFVSATRARDELVITSQFIAYGKEGDYHMNRFLIDALDCVGEKLDSAAVLQEKANRKKLARQKAKEAEAAE